MNKRERIAKTGLTTALWGIVAVAATAAFSRNSRREIRRRDRHQCVECGRTYGLEAHHWDHTKDETYDDPERGNLLCRIDHYIYHLMFQGNAEEIGLKEHQNNWAISMIWDRMNDWERAEALRRLNK